LKLNYLYGAQEIKKRIPQREPFLFLDTIISCNPGESIIATKKVLPTEPHFDGHFPEYPVMPGVLIIEAMGQAGGVLVWDSIPPKDRNFILYLVGVEKARFRKPIVPGDEMIITVEIINCRRNFWRFKAKVEVEGSLCATAEILESPGMYSDS
tara:strand:- start:110662 stop:111120 length:459 start_codon:yes stop_codon:yes gene_type:complete